MEIFYSCQYLQANTESSPLTTPAASATEIGPLSPSSSIKTSSRSDSVLAVNAFNNAAADSNDDGARTEEAYRPREDQRMGLLDLDSDGIAAPSAPARERARVSYDSPISPSYAQSQLTRIASSIHDASMEKERTRSVTFEMQWVLVVEDGSVLPAELITPSYLSLSSPTTANRLIISHTDSDTDIGSAEEQLDQQQQQQEQPLVMEREYRLLGLTVSRIPLNEDEFWRTHDIVAMNAQVRGRPSVQPVWLLLRDKSDLFQLKYSLWRQV